MEVVSCEDGLYTVNLTEINEANEIAKVDIAEALLLSGYVESVATALKGFSHPELLFLWKKYLV